MKLLGLSWHWRSQSLHLYGVFTHCIGFFLFHGTFPFPINVLFSSYLIGKIPPLLGLIVGHFDSSDQGARELQTDDRDYLFSANSSCVIGSQSIMVYCGKARLAASETFVFISKNVSCCKFFSHQNFSKWLIIYFLNWFKNKKVEKN